MCVGGLTLGTLGPTQALADPCPLVSSPAPALRPLSHLPDQKSPQCFQSFLQAHCLHRYPLELQMGDTAFAAPRPCKVGGCLQEAVTVCSPGSGRALDHWLGPSAVGGRGCSCSSGDEENPNYSPTSPCPPLVPTTLKSQGRTWRLPSGKMRKKPHFQASKQVCSQ